LIILFSVCGLNSYGAMEYEREESMGYIIPEQALLQVGQTLLKAGVQFAAQGAFQGYEKQAGGLMAAWGKNFMGEATVNFLQQLTTNTLNGAIDAVELSYDDDGNLEGLGFDMERWGESVYGVRALAGYAGSFARSATQSLLKGTAVGFLGEGANNYNALIKTASALAGEGVGSLIDGEFSINVLNLTDILSPFIEDKDLLAKMDMGLFSMNFARDKNGNLRTTSRINSAGANVGGLVGLARSVAGLTEAYDNIRIGLSGADEKTAIALRGISTNGQEASQSLFDQILSGETTLQEAYRVAVGEIAKTTSTADGKEISLNMEDLNGFELGVVLAHEAMRNGRNDGEEGQRLETIDAVLAHSDHAMQVLEKYGLGALGYQMVQEAIDYAKMQNGEISQEDFEAYVDGKYDSSADFWKIIYTRDESGQIVNSELIDDGLNSLTIIDGFTRTFLEADESDQADRFQKLAQLLGVSEQGLYQRMLSDTFKIRPEPGSEPGGLLLTITNQAVIDHLVESYVSGESISFDGLQGFEEKPWEDLVLEIADYNQRAMGFWQDRFTDQRKNEDYNNSTLLGLGDTEELVVQNLNDRASRLRLSAKDSNLNAGLSLATVEFLNSWNTFNEEQYGIWHVYGQSFQGELSYLFNTQAPEVQSNLEMMSQAEHITMAAYANSKMASMYLASTVMAQLQGQLAEVFRDKYPEHEISRLPWRPSEFVDRTFPRGFTNADQFNTAMQELKDLTSRLGDPLARIGVSGSSVTGVSFKEGRPFGPQSDIDVFVESSTLAGSLKQSSNIPGFIHPRRFMEAYPNLGEWAERWSATLGREVSIGGFLTDYLPVRPAIFFGVQ
jgi:hypothetical protein